MADPFITVKKRLFQTFTAVSESSSAEDGCTDTNAYQENILNSFTLGKIVPHGCFSCCEFCCRCSDT